MPHLEWNESLRVHVEELDRQHRAFTGRVESFQDSLSSGEAVLNSEIMKTMLNRIFAHIATEDARYRDFNRPD